MAFQYIDIPRFQEILEDQNGWKTDSSELTEKSLPKHRHMMRVLPDTLIRDDPRCYHLVLGPRRSGKTTLLWQSIDSLLDKGIPRERIFFVELDHPELQMENLGAIADALLLLCPDASIDEPIFLFLDEIGASDDWDLWLKNLLAQNRPIRVLASSSSGMILANNDKRKPESGPDRWAEYRLMACNFMEWCEFVFGDASVIPKWCRTGYPSLRARLQSIPQVSPVPEQVATALDRYLITGGYPVCITGYDHSTHNPSLRAAVRRDHGYLKEVVGRAVDKDIVAFHDVRDRKTLEAVMHSVAGLLGKQTTVAKIGKQLGEAQGKTTSTYLSHLENANILFRLDAYSDAPMRKAGNQKYCFFDPAVPSAVRRMGTSGLEDLPKKGHVLENAAGAALKELAENSWMTLEYWRLRETYEVDFIFGGETEDPLAFEVGNSKDHHLKGLKKLVEEKEKFRGNSYMVTPRSPVVRPEHHPLGIGELPLAVFLLAANAQSVQEMILRGGVTKGKNYRVLEPCNLYHRKDPLRPQFTDGDVVFLTESEAEAPLSAGQLEPAPDLDF